jgi:hypothetical protein
MYDQGVGDMISLNLGRITAKAHNQLAALDRSNVGSPDYMGIAAFWDQGFKLPLRELTPAKRRQAHQYMVERGAMVEQFGAFGYFISSKRQVNHDLYVDVCERFGANALLDRKMGGQS